MRRMMALGAAVWLAATSPALAAMADQAFKDVPANHWAAQAVDEMAVKRSLMKVYPDDTFRGDQPFTRAQLAESLDSLVNEVEAISKTSWKDGSPYHDVLSDVPDSDPDRPVILSMVNDYHLWHGVPTIDPEHFKPDETVTREEVAQVVRNLLSGGEAQKAVLPRDPRDPRNPFRDLTPAEWAYKAILADDQRYRVMIGFPDVTFRPDTKLTRYQYAAVGAQTFGMIRELVRKSAEERDALTPLTQQQLFQGTRPFYVGGTGLAPSSSLTGNPVGPEVRGVFYPGDQFVMADAQLGLGGKSLGGAGTLDWLWGRPNLGGFQFQPYLGARYMTQDQSVNFAPGLLVYKNWGPLGVDANVDWNLVGHSFSSGQAISGNHAVSLGGSLEYAPNPAWAVYVGPSVGFAGPSSGAMFGANAGVSF